MRMHLILGALALAGCQQTPVGPYRPFDPPPSGLNVSLAEGPLDPRGPIPTPTTISADGDSVLVIATLSSSCRSWSPSAGVADGALVITAVDRMPPSGRTCLAVANLGLFRAVVRPAPPGTYEAVFRTRIIDSNAEETEVERGRARVSVP